MKLINSFINYTLLLYILIALVYWIMIRPVHMNWGATLEEQRMKLPGDSLISPNCIVSTRAININSSNEKIWPWIAQTGQNRGGFNSYYWLENLFGAKMVNATSIHPEWQAQAGDTVYYGKDQFYGLVSSVKQNEYYAIQGWTFYLRPVDSFTTRLIVRYPSFEVKHDILKSLYYYGVFESLHFIMESGMMMGIKQKAELEPEK